MTDIEFYEVVQRCAPQDVPVLVEYLERHRRQTARKNVIRGFVVGVVTTLVTAGAVTAYQRMR